MKKRDVIILIIATLIVSSTLIGILLPRYLSKKDEYFVNWVGKPLAEDSASLFKINQSVTTRFGTYFPEELNYIPNLPAYKIEPNLANVDLQGYDYLDDELIKQLEENGFALEETKYYGWDNDIVDFYGLNIAPFFITTDVCLHLYHMFYDFSLQIIENYNFSSCLEEMIELLRIDQLNIHSTISDDNILWATKRNIAYLSVILSLLNESTIIPDFCEEMVLDELENINNEKIAFSPIFDYLEIYSLYKVRGHYTSSETLSKYFKAMMYAGRMGFLLQESLNQSRMALLLLKSFNSGIDSEKIMNLWKCIYEPTVFYVGESDDLTIYELNQSWVEIGSPDIEQLGNNTVIENFIDVISSYRKPTINSMLISSMDDFENKTQSFRLFGQRFIPDSYIFQELVHDRVIDRYLPNGLDIFSVLGSTQAEYNLNSEKLTYVNYYSQIQKLRTEFGSFNETAWTQNLYWLWIYSLLPLLKPASNGYPAFMLNDAWTNKALMTTMGSWTELRHDTQLYAKELWEYPAAGEYTGYVEPYPEIYSRLSSLTQYLIDGLSSRQLALTDFITRCESLKNIYDTLTEISIKLLENRELTSTENIFIVNFGKRIHNIYNFEFGNFSISKERSAIIADVAGMTDGLASYVLEVAIGNPFRIFVIVPDSSGRLKLTRGATYSYYEFIQPAEDILNDEEWQEMLDNNPPEFPDWIINSLPIKELETSIIVMIVNVKKKHEIPYNLIN